MWWHQPGLFTEDLIKTLHVGCDQPQVMPLSNPTSRVEATPEDILKWTGGKALVAAGASLVTDTMLTAASNALAKQAPVVQGTGDRLLPELGGIQEISRAI